MFIIIPKRKNKKKKQLKRALVHQLQLIGINLLDFQKDQFRNYVSRSSNKKYYRHKNESFYKFNFYILKKKKNYYFLLFLYIFKKYIIIIFYYLYI